jgi:hypothetical protein
MADLMIYQAKPNPSGKDSYKTYIPPEVIAGEWIDIYNHSLFSVSIENYSICHKAYKDDGSYEYELAGTLSGILPAKNVLRLHSGGFLKTYQMYPIDREGADIHVFTGKGYIWNNDKSDTPLIYDYGQKKIIDSATYNAYPPEGIILRRSGDKLLPV